MPTALAISPHLDDAVFSAGGILARLARLNWRVTVATVFTASVSDPKGFALACQLDKGLSADVDYMALRRKEDAAACAAIGAEPLWMPFVEAPHRGYVSAAGLFDGMREDDKIVDEIAPVLSEMIECRAPDLILAPQAIGAHVDHVAVYLAVLLALRSSRRLVWLWSDFPYASRPGDCRRPFATEIDVLVEKKVELGPDELADKISATTAYVSQLGFQFGGMQQAKAAMATFAQIERFRTIS